MKLEVGRQYRNRAGAVVKIIRDKDEGSRFIDESGDAYTENGEWFTYENYHRELIESVDDVKDRSIEVKKELDVGLTDEMINNLISLQTKYCKLQEQMDETSRIYVDNGIFYSNKTLLAAYNELKKENDQIKEQQIKEIPVGLRSDQVYGLWYYIEKNTMFDRYIDQNDFIDVVQSYLKTQTFAQPEIKEVVVGLTDEQVERLQIELNLEGGWWYKKIQDWLKTQTFAQSYKTDGFAEMQLEECGYEYRKLQSELEQLKTQQFTPDWDNAPEWANWVAQDKNGSWCWYKNEPAFMRAGVWRVDIGESKPVCFSNVQETLQRRPIPPKQKVEIGQVWKHSPVDSKYVIDSLGRVKDEGKYWRDCVTYSSLKDGQFYTRPLTDFLAKFEQVKP